MALPPPGSGDILDDFAAAQKAPRYRSVDVAVGMVVEDRFSGFCGDVVKWSSEAVTLRDRRSQLRHFGWKDGGFLVDGVAVTLRRPPAAPSPKMSTTTASGSVAVAAGPARVAAASRIWVEGRHDAELLELVWGDDLRHEGIVVEPLHGIDHLASAVAEFRPAAARRLGVLVDHYVSGSKERRLGATITDPNVLVTGHPFVDVWEGVRPEVLGIERWPVVERGIDWKTGVCTALGTTVDGFWPRLRNRVGSYADLRPELVGAVERLIDFVAS